ncbi:hypothetical protein QTP88_022763 [Uroleucon formosanum]
MYYIIFPSSPRYPNIIQYFRYADATLSRASEKLYFLIDPVELLNFDVMVDILATLGVGVSRSRETEKNF